VRIANIEGRLALVTPEETAMDVALASDGRFGPDPMSAYEDWEAFVEWAVSAEGEAGAFEPAELGPPVPRPQQVFAIGVNYREHADEAGYPPDSLPVTFTKFPSSLTGPDALVQLPEGNVDWEVELVVVVGRGGHRIAREDAWNHVAGMMVGQDLSERVAQLEGTRPQFSLAKSHPGFSPTGPWVVTTDEFQDPSDLAISCALDGEVLQDSRTSNMIYDIPELIARLSAVVSLLPGDLIFTGTPSGIGNARTAKQFLHEGETLVSTIEGIGSITTRFA
jgi:2-keto-4-pentenoate hydratase/2-oxohepta-3-ene-1,7-dioic acid hydratase in catechol pathway